jgi:hypothetical protein
MLAGRRLDSLAFGVVVLVAYLVLVPILRPFDREAFPTPTDATLRVSPTSIAKPRNPVAVVTLVAHDWSIEHACVLARSIGATTAVLDTDLVALVLGSVSARGIAIRFRFRFRLGGLLAALCSRRMAGIWLGRCK